MGVRGLMVAGLTAGALLACSPPASQAPEQNNAPLGANQMQPGQYRTTVTMLDMSMPGVPAAAMAQMQSRPVTTEYCVEASDIADMAAYNMNNPESGMSCTNVRTNSVGGHIDNEVTCTGPMGTMNTHMIGTYTPTRVEMETTSTTQMPQGAMTQRAQIVTERIGDCPAGGTAAAP
jgi:hypothetical protein